MQTTTGGSPITIKHTMPDEALREIFDRMSDEEFMAGAIRAEGSGVEGLVYLDEHGVGYFKK